MPNTPAPSGPPLTISAREIASLLGISVYAFHRLRKREGTPFTIEPVIGGGYGNRLLWSRAQVMDWFREQGLDPDRRAV